MRSGDHPVCMARKDRHQAVVLVGVGFGVLMDVHQAAMIEYGPFPLGYRFQLADEIRELLGVPSADVAQDPLRLG